MPRSKKPSKHLPQNKTLKLIEQEIDQLGWQVVRETIVAAYSQRCMTLEQKYQQPADQLNLRGRSATKLTLSDKQMLPLCYLYRLKEAYQAGSDDRTSLKAIADEEMQLLRRGYSEEYISKNLLGTYHNLLRTAIAKGQIHLNERNSIENERYDYSADRTQTYRQHYSLIFLKLPERYHHEQRLEREQRLTEQMGDLQPVKLQPYLEKTQQLLQSDDPYDLAVGIAAATGRRFSEVLARGLFREADNPYQLLFSGQLKTDDPQPYLVYSVLPAQEVIEAIARLRNHPKVALLNSSDEDEATIKQVNALNSAINGRCQRHYEKSQIVRPLLIDQHISMHSLRRAYAAIMLRIATANATHLHRPPNVDPLQFAAQNLGHEANGNATKHYLCYYVVDDLHQDEDDTGSATTETLRVSEDAPQTSTEATPEEISIPISGGYQQQLSEIGSRLGLPQTDTQPLFEALMDLLTLKLDAIADVVCGVSEPTGVQQQIDQLKAMQLHLQQQVWILQSNSDTANRPVGFPKRRGRSANPVDFSEMSSQKLKKSTRKGSATEKLRRALKALQEHNDRAEGRSQKWHINLSTLKNLTGCFVPSIRAFMDDYAQEIKEHNHSHDLDEGVNKAHGQMGEKVEHLIQW